MFMNKGGWLSEKGVMAGMLTGLGCWWVAVILLVVNWQRLPPEMPWFFSMPWGEQQLIEKTWLGVMVFTFGGVMIVNGLLVRLIGGGEELLKRVLIWGGVTCELLMVLSLIRVIMVVL